MAEAWLNTEKTGERGQSNTYADEAVECMLLIRNVFTLALRQTQGFVNSIMKLAGFILPVPNYSTLSRRQKGLDVKLPRKKQSREGIHVVVDSTGLKVFGYGEWHMRKHHLNKDGSERKKPRLWRKIHIGIDEATQEVVAVVTTVQYTHDKTALPNLLGKIDEPIRQVSGDKGYDYISCYKDIGAVGAELVIPPRNIAVINDWDITEKRDAAVRRIEEIGREEWKKETNSHRRSLAETAVFRPKVIFGPNLHSRLFENQSVEARLRCKALNIMTHLGMPDSYPVPVVS